MRKPPLLLIILFLVLGNIQIFTDFLATEVNSGISAHSQNFSGGTGMFGIQFPLQQKLPLVANSTDGIAIDYWNNQKEYNKRSQLTN